MLLALAIAPGASSQAADPLPAGHYGGPASGSWTVTSSPKWLKSLALTAIELREGVDEIPSSGTCGGFVGLDVPGGGGPITGAARCEFPGELARYNDRVATLTATETATGVAGTATCCGSDQQVAWSAERNGESLTGSVSGSTSVTPVSVSTRFGSVEVSLRVDWSVQFEADRAP